jgi:hypothetical protein
VSSIHIADTGVFVAIGRPSNHRYRALRTYARRNEIVFVVPRRVYDELTADDSDLATPPIEQVIEEDWATVGEQLDFTNPLVSRVMDGVRRFIASADDRNEDDIEQADAALAALAAQHLDTERATDVYIYTTDIAAGEGAETVFASEGYEDSVTFVNAFELIEDLVDVNH